MTQPQRDRLAAAQRELLDALLANGPVPAGFAPERIEAERRALLNKRRNIVAVLRPDVAAELGDRFRPLFADYARQHPKRADVRFREDAAAFAAWAAELGELALSKSAAPPGRAAPAGRATPLERVKRWWRRAGGRTKTDTKADGKAGTGAHSGAGSGE